MLKGVVCEISAILHAAKIDFNILFKYISIDISFVRLDADQDEDKSLGVMGTVFSENIQPN
ncbi:MAG: hypothetical protein J6S69_05090 [Proteobacteria bacterium]|nr:hypothetical protein [Pseudomonadota bacterium]